MTPVCQCSLVDADGKPLWSKQIRYSRETLRCRDCGGQMFDGSDEAVKRRARRSKAIADFAKAVAQTLDEDIARVLTGKP